MGAQIYREHEEQVARFVSGPPNFDSTQYQVHIHRVNDRRRELSYEPISDSILPTHLTAPQALPGIGLDLSSLASSGTHSFQSLALQWFESHRVRLQFRDLH